MKCSNDFEWDVPKQDNVANSVTPCKTDDNSVLKLFLKGDSNGISMAKSNFGFERCEKIKL